MLMKIQYTNMGWILFPSSTSHFNPPARVWISKANQPQITQTTYDDMEDFSAFLHYIFLLFFPLAWFKQIGKDNVGTSPARSH